MGITPAMVMGGASMLGSLAGMFGGNKASDVKLPPMYTADPTPGLQGAQTAIGNLGQYNLGAQFMPGVLGIGQQYMANPYASGYQAGTDMWAGMGGANALSGLGMAGMVGGTVLPQIGAGNALLGQAFDPQGALYGRTAQQVSDQALTGLSRSGLAGTPWGQGVYGKTMGDFNIDWQNAQLQRMIQGGQGAQGLFGGALQSATGGFGLGAGAIGSGLQMAGMPFGTYGNILGTALGGVGGVAGFGNQISQIPQLQAGDWLNYIGQAGGINQTANQTAQLALKQQQQGFDQNQALGKGLGQGFAMMTGMTPNVGTGQWPSFMRGVGPFAS